ncbi:MAG: transporter substrate-binding domain-containing protein [Erysipelotrichaceae bacterium]|nr:transporter substrate-binding domain-containing protein [Erysipelotrichaceae bacterium]MDY5252093.1 transporter substrate-binding domain-containing protein [Erysipelotrichaceae bacterium]
MKKLFMTILVMMMLVGCASTETVDLSANTPNPTKETTTATTDRLEQIKQNGKLVVATSPDYAPLEFIDTSKSGQDQYVGSDMALARHIAQQLGVELEIKAMDFGMVLSSVDLGQVDLAIAGLGYEPERQNNFEMSIGYNQEGESGCQGLMVKADEYDQYQSLDDFADKKIIAQSGSLQEGYVKSQLPEAELQLVSTLDLAVMSLLSDKVDAFACSCDQMKAYEKNYSDIKMSSVEFDTTAGSEYAGNIVLIQKGQENLLNEVNAIIEEVNEQGLYENWSKEAKELAKDLGLEFEE